MSRSKQNREAWLRKLKQREKRRVVADQPDGLVRTLQEIAKQIEAGPVVEFPGACHASVSRPDMVKLALGMFTRAQEPGRSKLKQLERQYRVGKLDFLPDLDHWAMEEFFWHGLPDDSWEPLEAFLQQEGDQFPSDARQQLRRWKEAELKVLEIGEVRDATVRLRPWNLCESRPDGAWFRAIDLSISGVNLYRSHAGSITLTYVAPWAPEEDLFCAMGYGGIVPKQRSDEFLLPSYLSDARLACARWPWQVDTRSEREYAATWRQRDWQSWFEQRVTFPFQAVLASNTGFSVHFVEDIVRVPSQTARQVGIYFTVRCDDAKLLVGGTAVMPLDMSTPNAATFAEYRAYRDIAGPPPQAHRMNALLVS